MLISDLSHLEVVTEDKNIQGGDLSAIQMILANTKTSTQALADALASAAGANSAFTYTNTNTVTVSLPGALFAASSQSSSVALSS